MRAIASSLSLALLCATLALAGCGEDPADRGIAPVEPFEEAEPAVPESERELGETEAEREQQDVEEEQTREIEEFDDAAGGEPQP
jgi:hypothetical protein